MTIPEETVEEEHSGSGASQADLIASYVAFASRAVRVRRGLAAFVFLGVGVLTVIVVSIWPRTYHCEMKLVTQRTEMLNVRGNGGDGFRGAAEAIMRHENLAAIVKQTELAKNWPLSRPPVMKLKDRLTESIRGPVGEADLETMLVATLESKLSVNAGDTTMTLGVDWPEPKMAARIVEATEQLFLEARHNTDVSTIAEYISILEGHASDLRQEIDTIADQVQKLTGDHGKPADRNAPPPDVKNPTAPPRRVIPRPRLQLDEDLPRLKTTLELKQSTLKALQEDRKRRVHELEARLTEAKSRYTPAHPIVVDLEKQMAAMSADTPEMTALAAAIAQLEAEIKERTQASLQGTRVDPQGGLVPTPPPGTPQTANGDAPPAGPLPTDVMQLVQNGADSVDPAIAAQFRYVVSKYTTVRDQISTARIDLDTAQAAFRYRYKVLIPAEVPSLPIKPKVPILLAGGWIAGLFLAFLLPIALELKRGKIVAKWQVAQIHLPVLAELRFPPGPPSE